MLPLASQSAELRRKFVELSRGAYGIVEVVANCSEAGRPRGRLPKSARCLPRLLQRWFETVDPIVVGTLLLHLSLLPGNRFLLAQMAAVADFYLVVRYVTVDRSFRHP